MDATGRAAAQRLSAQRPPGLREARLAASVSCLLQRCKARSAIECAPRTASHMVATPPPPPRGGLCIAAQAAGCQRIARSSSARIHHVPAASVRFALSVQ